MPVVRVYYQDPFKPVLFNSPAFDVTLEQKEYIKDILDKSCSDSRFAEKAYMSILLVLTQGSTVAPSIASLNPTQATLGSPNFTLHVNGAGFDEGSKIIWNGSEEITTRVSQTELTTEVNMATAEVAIDLPVAVMNNAGVVSNAMTFSLKNP